MTSDPVKELSNHACSARFEDLPEETIRAVIHAVVDTAGASLAGCTSDFGSLVIARAADNGGAPQSSLLGSRLRIPVAEAAFANAVVARSLELDDVHEDSPRTGRGHGGHINVCIVPAVLAAAEATDRAITGRQLITACAVGGDVMARIRLAAGDAGKLGWEGPTVAPFGVAAALANLLGLSPERAAAAMSAAYAQCAGNIQSTTDGGWDVWLNAGTGARAGVLAVELAVRGYRGTSAPLLGKSGLYPLYFRGEYHPEALLGDLGRYFEGANVSIKPYATCKASHHALYTASEIMRRSGREPGNVRRIVVGSSAYKMRLVALDSGGGSKPLPGDLGAAQFHLPFAMATCLLRGSVLPKDLVESLEDPAVRTLASRIAVRHLPAKDELQRIAGYPPDDVEIEFDDGSIASGCEEFVVGHPRNPMSASELCNKFRRCAGASRAAGFESLVNQFLETVLSLPAQRDIRPLPSLLNRIAVAPEDESAS